MASITKKSDGKYLIRVSKGTGSRRSFINKTFYGKLADAREFAREQETLFDTLGASGRDIALTFERYFEIWLGAVKPKISPRTFDGYEGNIRRYALKALGRYRLNDIRTFHIQAIYNEVGQLRSATTVRNLHASLNVCFSYAYKREYIRTNPCRNLDLPKKEYREISVLRPSDVPAFIRACQEMPNGLIFEFALETGMRPEEYLALRWKDYQAPNISVSQVVQYNRKGGGFYFALPKTAKSRRMISISDTLAARLTRHRREQNEHRLAMKGTWFNNDLVFPDIVGNPYPLSNLTRRYFHPILERCGFAEHLTLYSLRHSCATLLLTAGVSPKTVADRLGHASVVMTLDVYSHVLPEIQSAATATLREILQRGL